MQSWRRAWLEVIPFYAFPADVRRILYTTNAMEALNAKLRRAVRVRGHFPTDEAAIKLLFLVLHRTEKTWMVDSIGRRNTEMEGSAMAGRRRSDRALRNKLRSPGRPPVA